MTIRLNQFYIDGRWCTPSSSAQIPVVNPATEQTLGMLSMGDAADADRAVQAARVAFEDFSSSSVASRRMLLLRILENYTHRYDDFVKAISDEMGAPVGLARDAQAAIGVAHLKTMIDILEHFQFSEQRGQTLIVHEPVGVCALITPWNWPINQIAAKVVPALAAGCTMVLKPSEYSPLSAALWAEVMDSSGVPAGVFNLVHGNGTSVGAALASHPEVDMVSFTGSTRAGIEVAIGAAPTVKRVHQELGGKSPNLLLDDTNIEHAVRSSVMAVLRNSGQSCNAPTRLLVPRKILAAVENTSRHVVESVEVGDPRLASTVVGPVVSRVQFDRIQSYLEKGVSEGARIIVGGAGKPKGCKDGYYVQPTVFSDVNNSMTIAREEIFGPVLVIIPYDSEEQAVEIANDTPYGLAAYVWSEDLARAARVANRIRAGQVIINGVRPDPYTPFGGFKRSGNGREWGEFGLRDFLEIKAVVGGPE